eukprot:UN23754
MRHFNILYLEKKLSNLSCFAILLTAGSCAFACYAQINSASDATQQIFGLVFAFASVALFGSEYVFGNEIFTRVDRDHGAKPECVAFVLGTTEMFFLSIYFGAYVVPNWKNEFADEIHDKGENPSNTTT